MAAPSEPDLLAASPLLADFADFADPRSFLPVPSDFLIGLADVVRSGDAVSAGRYKAVNMAGVAAIAALANAVGPRRFPFVFGGDGASFVVPASWREIARTALAQTAGLVRDEFDLDLRTALVPVAAIRDAGLDLRIARFAVSPHLDQAMFSGGGLAWAENAMKSGRFAVDPAPPGSRPDLSGLSCRFSPAPSRRGTILSVIVRPTGRGGDRYGALVARILRLVEDSPGMARPVPEAGPPLGWRVSGARLEAGATWRHGTSSLLHRWRVSAFGLLSFLVLRFRIRLGRFDPTEYLAAVVANSDYRKYDDGLRMTIDCATELADTIEAELEAAERDGIARFGLHRQGASLMTCFTHSVLTRDHLHFVDGADGGYARAASRLKDDDG